MASGSSLLNLGQMNEVDDDIKQEEDIRVVVPPKKRRNRPGMPYPDARVIALSPTSLMGKNRFICEVCDKGFPREQNLQLHKRGHNLPWKLKQQRPENDVVKRKVYLCPEPSCVHHDPCRALGDLTGIKKHYFRKHGEKKYKCKRCTKVYAVESDLKAHSKICGKKEYQCHCGTIFTRRDSFISHRAFCEALAQAGPMSSKAVASSSRNPPSLMIKPSIGPNPYKASKTHFMPSTYQSNEHIYEAKSDTMFLTNLLNNTTTMPKDNNFSFIRSNMNSGKDRTSMVIGGGNVSSDPSSAHYLSSHTRVMPQLPATTLLQKAALIGSTSSNNSANKFAGFNPSASSSTPKYEQGKCLFGSENLGSSDSKMIELLNSFSSSGAGSSIYNLSYGAAYGQEESRNGGYDNTWKLDNSEEQNRLRNGTLSNMGIQQSTGVRFTRDFLGVGEKIVRDIRSEGPESAFSGKSFL
uniref:protein indeterminate-domain 4, chloroplastic-like n=1 Tax=Erigeron canadensis TaxID=72917 RepID=UPI001CB904F7|nr:protein indeterminate-domain 4, chloroplastic-like [Erigeron canadensis]